MKKSVETGVDGAVKVTRARDGDEVDWRQAGANRHRLGFMAMRCVGGTGRSV